MSYQVLARKWRPRNFHEMVGQEHVLQALVNALDHDRLHHAYLFTGTRGVGKTTIARILAKCLNCEAGVSSQPCGECSSCLEIAEGRSVDLLEVDAASRTKVEDTRELLENVQYAPTRSRYKVYLIDEVHMLSSHSFNALLKTLEEPPPHVKFLLATTDPQKLPATILSRCLQFNLKNMPPEQIVGHLSNVLGQESVDFEEPALWLLGRAAAGSMRDALSLTDQAIAFGSGRLSETDVRSMLGSVDLSFVYRLLEGLASGDPAGLLQTVEHMAEHAPDFEGALDELISLLHRVAVAQVVPEAIENRWGDAQQIASVASAITAEDAQLFYQIALNSKRDISLASDARSGFEMALLRMVAFRPAAVLDHSLRPEDIQALPSAPGSTNSAAVGAATVAPEVDPPVKKPRKAPVAAPAPVAVVAPAAAELAPAAITALADAPDVDPESDAEQEQPPRGFELADLQPADWQGLLEKLGLVGMVYNIARHSELRRVAHGQLHFVLDPDNASLFNSGHSDKIRHALEQYFGESLSVDIAPGELQGETPAMQHDRLARERQIAAVAAIESDPVLQKLIVRFDGELDRASIMPVDS
jgi:DNA polymerase-3 subunit gamma/tau